MNALGACICCGAAVWLRDGEPSKQHASEAGAWCPHHNRQRAFCPCGVEPSRHLVAVHAAPWCEAWRSMMASTGLALTREGLDVLAQYKSREALAVSAGGVEALASASA